MRVSEAIGAGRTVLGKEIEIEGVAEVTGSFSVIYDEADVSARSYGNPVGPAVLVHGDCLYRAILSLPEPLPALGGTEVGYFVKVRVLGISTFTGRAFAPMQFGHIYEIEVFDSTVGTQKLVLNPHLIDIYFRQTRPLTAIEVRKFEPYFPEVKNLVALKRLLEEGEHLMLAKRIPEDQLEPHLELLRRAGASFELIGSPIANGIYGMP